MDLSKLNSILLDFFPIVLNHIILEYVVPVRHEFLLKKTIQNPIIFNHDCCVSGDYIFVFHADNNMSKYKLLDDYGNRKATFISSSMCVYNNCIYVATGHTIEVFDEKDCRHVRTVKNYCYGNINIAADKIFGSEVHEQILSITDLYGRGIKKCIMSHKFFSMQICDNYLYVLTLSENIYKYSFDGILIENYDFSLTIYNFFVIDERIYVWTKDGVFDYHSYDIPKKIFEIKTHEPIMQYENNWYVLSTDGTLMYVYNVVKKNIRTILHEKN